MVQWPHSTAKSFPGAFPYMSLGLPCHTEPSGLQVWQPLGSTASRPWGETCTAIFPSESCLLSLHCGSHHSLASSSLLKETPHNPTLWPPNTVIHWVRWLITFFKIKRHGADRWSINVAMFLQVVGNHHFLREKDLALPPLSRGVKVHHLLPLSGATT